MWSIVYFRPEDISAILGNVSSSTFSGPYDVYRLGLDGTTFSFLSSSKDVDLKSVFEEMYLLLPKSADVKYRDSIKQNYFMEVGDKYELISYFETTYGSFRKDLSHVLEVGHTRSYGYDNNEFPIIAVSKVPYYIGSKKLKASDIEALMRETRHDNFLLPYISYDDSEEFVETSCSNVILTKNLRMDINQTIISVSINKGALKRARSYDKRRVVAFQNKGSELPSCLYNFCRYVITNLVLDKIPKEYTRLCYGNVGISFLPTVQNFVEINNLIRARKVDANTLSNAFSCFDELAKDKDQTLLKSVFSCSVKKAKDKTQYTNEIKYLQDRYNRMKKTKVQFI